MYTEVPSTLRGRELLPAQNNKRAAQKRRSENFSYVIKLFCFDEIYEHDDDTLRLVFNIVQVYAKSEEEKSSKYYDHNKKVTNQIFFFFKTFIIT